MSSDREEFLQDDAFTELPADVVKGQEEWAGWAGPVCDPATVDRPCWADFLEYPPKPFGRTEVVS